MKGKKKGKVKILIVITVLIAAFLCGMCFGGGIYYLNKKEPETVSSNNVYAEKADNKYYNDNSQYIKIHNIKDTDKNKSSSDEKINSNYTKGCYIQTKILSSQTDEKVAYLTFDDGPTYTTPKILDILDKYNIKATFFVVGSMCKNNPQILRREFSRGEYICNHTYSHDYKYLYSNPENFIADIKKCEDTIDAILGQDYKTTLVRFPGGSSDKGKIFNDSLVNAGYNYVDWNALSGDAEKKDVPVDTLVENVKTTMAGHKKIIILMHDCTQINTVTALPIIIEYLKSQGYTFKTLREA